MPLQNSPPTTSKPERLALTYREATTSLGTRGRSIVEMIRTGIAEAISLGRSRRLSVAERERLLSE
jgi:hypothetical protein